MGFILDKDKIKCVLCAGSTSGDIEKKAFSMTIILVYEHTAQKTEELTFTLYYIFLVKFIWYKAQKLLYVEGYWMRCMTQI